MKKHAVIIIPGIFEDVQFVKLLTKNWEKKFNIIPYVFHFQWKKGQYEAEIKRAQKLIDDLSRYHKVSLIGRSAGGSAVINLFSQRQQAIQKVITVCSRVDDSKKPIRRLTKKLRPNYVMSVRNSEKQLLKITESNRKKIMTIRPLGDPLVPLKTIPINGAVNKRVPIVGHILTGFSALTFYRKQLIDFLQEN